MSRHYALPSDNQFHIAAQHLWQNVADVSAAIIFVPTEHAAAAFTNALIDTAPQRATHLLPEILPLNPDAASIVIPHQQKPLSPLKRQFFLYQQVKKRAKLQNLALPLKQAWQTAESLAQLLDQLHRYHIEPTQIQTLLEAHRFSRHLWDNLFLLNIILETYPLWLNEENMKDPVLYKRDQFSLWTKNVNVLPETTPLYAVGFQDTTPDGIAFLRMLTQKENATFFWPSLCDAHNATPLEELSPAHPDYALKHLWHTLEVLPPLPSPTSLPTSSYRFIAAPHQEMEAQAIALMLKESFVQKQTAMLVASDANFGAKVAQYLSLWGITADNSGGIPFSQKPFVQFFQFALTLLADFDILNLANFIHHPLFKDAAKADIMDTLLLRGTAVKNWKGLLWKASQLQHTYPKPPEHSIAEAQALTQHLANLFTPATISLKDQKPTDYLLKVHQIVTALCQDTSTEQSADWQNFWQEFQQLIQEAQTPFSKSEIASLFQGITEKITIRPAGEKNIIIRGPLQARYHTADRIIISNLTSQDWPQPPKPHPWLNDQLITELGLPNTLKTIGLTSSHFQTLVQRPAEIMLTYSLTTPEGKQQQKSTLLSDFEHTLPQPLLEKAYKEGETYLTYAQKLTPDVESFYSPEGLLPDTLNNTENWSASFIEGLMSCPFKARLSRFYHVEELAPYNADPDARDKGNLVHNCLEAFFTTPDHAAPNTPPYFKGKITPDTLEEAYQHMLTILSFFVQKYPKEQAILWQKRLEPQLKLFLEHMAQHPENKPHLFEKKGTIPLTPHLNLSATADRIDLTPEGATILDYKTGNPPSPKDVQNGSKPQLALEALIAQQGAFSDDTRHISALEFWQISTGKKDFQPISIPFTEELIESTQSGLTHLVNHYSEHHHFTATPEADTLPKGICERCAFAGICRFQNQKVSA